MDKSDQKFREEFKPLSIPPSFERSESLVEQVVFSLASLGEATDKQVIAKLSEHLDSFDPAEVSTILKNYYDKGLLKGTRSGSDMVYNLSKITTPNMGYVDPDLLAPGLD